MSAQVLSFPGVGFAGLGPNGTGPDFAEPVRPGARWSRAALAGRLTEISGHGASSGLTVATGLLREAQKAGELCAWVTRPEQTFFPPDVARSGIDLDALAVVFVPSTAHAGRAAGRLLRSGAFGLVVIDLGAAWELPMPVQSRLSSLAIDQNAAVVLLTEKSAETPSVGSMISLRVEALRAAISEARFAVRVAALKDKRNGPGWTHEEVMYGPDGLR